MMGWNWRGLFSAIANVVVGSHDESSIRDDSAGALHSEHADVKSTAASHSGPALKRRGSRFGLPLALFTLLMGGASTAFAGDYSCGPTGDFQVLDGYNLPGGMTLQEFEKLSSLSFVGSCTIKNFPQDNGIGGFGVNSSLINFNLNTNDPTALIILDNVYYNGNMSCAKLSTDKAIIWWVNGSFNSIDSKCQAFLPPFLTGLHKRNPAGETSQTLGVPFTYTMTLAEKVALDVDTGLYSWTGQAYDQPIQYVRIEDDLTAAGASMSYVGYNAYVVDSGGGTTPFTFDTAPAAGDKQLVFESGTPSSTTTLIPANSQLIVELTVVLDDVAANTVGTTFVNDVDWYLSTDVTAADVGSTPVHVENVPGHSEPTEPMTIVAPDLTVSKSSPVTALNYGVMADFTIKAQNTGSSDAYAVTILDQFPNFPTTAQPSVTAGMCNYDPRTNLIAEIRDTDDTTVLKTLDLSKNEYTLNWTGDNGQPDACQLTFTMTNAAGPIAPNQYLVIKYDSTLDDLNSTDAWPLTNTATATSWYNSDNSSYAVQYTNTQAHHQDSYTLYTAMHGYYFEKTVTNATTGVGPGLNISAFAGDQLHYQIRLYNVDQTFSNVVITDALDLANLDETTFANLTINGVSSSTVPDASGVLTIGDGTLNLAQGDELIIEFDINLRNDAADAPPPVENQAVMTANGGFTAYSDDPYINGVSSPDIDTDQDKTPVYVESINDLTKANPTDTTVAIGEEFTYRIEITAPPQMPLYDVVIYDDVAASAADMEIVRATDPSGTWTLAHDTNSIWDTTSGIDIPAGGTATIDVTMRLKDTATNTSITSPLEFYNSATYTFHRINDPNSAVVTTGTVTTTVPMTLVEPDLTTSTKTASFVTPSSKVVGTDPATVGDVLQYTVTIPNNGDSTAFDTSVVDLLPADLSYNTGSTTVVLYDPSGPTTTTISNLDPVVLVDGSLVWGAQAGDNTFDIPVGQELRVTYQATVQSVTGTDITNSVHIDWTSLDQASAYERDGAGCPTVSPPDTYCYSPTPVTVTTQDNTALAKRVIDDSYIGGPYSATVNPVVRVGDTVTYELELSLQEYTTVGVTVTDVLPAGMEYVSGSYTIDPGATTFNYPAFNFTSDPTTRTLTWDFGDIENVPSGDSTPVDKLFIRYVARVKHLDTDNPPDPTESTKTYTNNASLIYFGYDPANAALRANAPVDVLQPQITSITKNGTVVGPAPAGGDGQTLGTAYVVDIVNNSMDFQLEACNDGEAPAYGAVISDTLAAQFDLSTLTVSNVYIWDPVALTQTAAANAQTTVANGDGTTTLNVQFNDPVDAHLCARVEYSIGFLTNIAPNQTWSNSATVSEYWSLPTLDPADAREYIAINPVTADSIWMTNTFTAVAPTKTVASPLTGEVTIGEPVSYTITVPGTPVNAELSNVVVSDTLEAALIYDNASVEVNGVPTAIVPVTSGQLLTWTIPSIPAGQQAVITLNTHVANTVDTDAGNLFANSADYTYDVGGVATAGGSSDPSTATLRIIEPTVTMIKSVANQSNPGNPPLAGDVLRYTLQLDALGGVALDNFSEAFDISIIDDLSLGLAYQTGTATLNVGALADPVNVTAGDGISTAQQLRWSLADGNNIDIPEGNSVTITYDVLVLDSVVAGQTLTNSAVAQWTGRDGVDANERDGSDGYNVEPNDYETAPQTTSLTVPDNSAFTKSVIADSDTATPISTLRIGDTVDYRLDITLQEGTTSGISVSDTLDPGLEFVGIVSINGDTVADYDPPASGAGSNFSYNTITAGSLPSTGASGTLTFSLGDVTNDPLGDATTDTLTIVYRARVVPGVLTQSPSTTLNNSAVLTYNTTSTLNSTASVTVLQPVMSTVTKLGNGATNTDTTPLIVNVANDTVQFTLESCNTTGLAPAYNVQLTDVLDSQLDEGSIKNLAVTINGTPATNGVDYNYTAPASRGGSLVFDLVEPVNPTQCVTVVYDIGFYTDFGPNELWNNSVTLDEYWSLDGNSGEQYNGSGPSSFWMTNTTAVTPLSKSVVSPTTGEITIGELVTYQIKVPATPVNAALDTVQVQDTLHDALLYQNDATAVFNSGASVTLTPTVNGQDITWDITQIPAGEQVTITFTARVDNNSAAQEGVSFANTAGYTYTGMTDPTQTQATSGALTITEPALAINKTVINTTNAGLPPVAGDILQYSVTLTASGGVAGDNFSDAFDVLIEDSLSLGLRYINGTATVDGTGNTITDPTTNGGDGITTTQVLTWSLADATADIDVAEGTTVTVTYNVEVLSSASAGQDLTNSARAQWTGIDGTDSFERNGTATPAENDYYTGPVSTTLTSQFAVNYTKSVVNTRTGQDPGTDASPGDTLQYTLTISNQSVSTLTNAAVVDELAAEFVPNTLNLVSVSDSNADSSNTNGTGGVNGTGIVDVRGITLQPQGTAGDTVTIVFTATLAPVIPNNTTVLNEAQLTGDSLPATTSNQTSTLISSAPVFDVWKTSADLTGDPAVLAPGDTLRYTITVKNIGDENATNATLGDLIPAYTTYVANSTTLNGSAVSDPSSGVSPLQNGMLINAPEDTTPGAMRADASATTSNVATITFEVTVNSNVVTGTVISNQGHVNATSTGTGSAISETLSDDPTTAALDDPTIDVVGNLVLIDAQKTVQLLNDNDGNGFVSAGDELRYTINISNQGSVAATGVTLVDAVPALTSFVSGSVTLNGNPVSDTGVSPLITGIQVNSPDGAGAGVISAGQSAVVTFDVSVDSTAAANDVISNQGTVSSNEQLDEPTDADGIDSNGDQPTTIVVGASQLLSITKDVFDLSGGDIVPGDEVEYVITVQNVSAINATDVVITDSIPSGLTYVNNTATLNGSNSGVVYAAPTLTANYGATYGDLAPGATAVLRFRATVNAATPTGTTITNTAVATWDAATKNASASASFLLGTSGLSGTVWLDTDFDNDPTNGGPGLSGWTVQLYRNTSQIGSVLTDTTGAYQFAGVAANATTSDIYSIRFLAPGAGSNTAKLGFADSPFTNEMQYITDIKVSGPTGGLNMPVRPNGVVYNSITRSPVAGATLRLLNASGQVVTSSCFDDPAQQGQVTLASGYYRFDLNFSDTTSCPANGNYTISVTAPATGYRNQPASQYIQPQTTPLDVPTCSMDAVPSTTSSCEVVAFNTAPPSSIVDGDPGATYYLNLTFDQNQVDVSGNVLDFNNQAFNNHIPLDPDLSDAVAISKTAAKVNVSRGEMVPYTITVNNGYSVALQSATIRDIYPAGFKYVKGSSRFDGKPVEPVGVGNTLSWENVDLTTGTQHTIKLVFIVGSGVSEGDYVNRAVVIDPTVAPPNNSLSGQAEATVRVIPDPNFDCTDVIGKVFDDKNLNGVQDDGEDGIQGARLVTARGLIVTSDKFGRFHITCAVVPNESRGSNYILKLDDRSLPSGYRVTTENPRVLRATRGKMLKFNFGATIHHVVRLDVADGVFEPGTTTMRQQWVPRIGLLLEQLKKSPSVLRISYLADVEDEGLVSERMTALKKTITKKWEELNCCYKLTIETEIYWRRGAPPERSDVID